MTRHHTPKSWPVQVEQTANYTYWQAQDGTYMATSNATILPPPVSSGGYYDLDALKRLKGDTP